MFGNFKYFKQVFNIFKYILKIIFICKCFIFTYLYVYIIIFKKILKKRDNKRQLKIIF